MEISIYYSIAFGGLLFAPLLTNFLWRRTPRVKRVLYQCLRLATYPYIIRRYRYFGPWTLAGIIAISIYVASNAFCLCFQALENTSLLGARAGNLALVNLAPLFLGPHLSFVADISGISLHSIRQTHSSIAFMCFILVLVHATIALSGQASSMSQDGVDISAIGSASSLVLSIVLSWKYLRKHFYEFFLRTHQITAIMVAVFTLLHIRSKDLPALYFYTGSAFCFTTSIVELIILIRNNHLLYYGKWKLPKVGEVFTISKDNRQSPIHLTIFCEPLLIGAGQYINIYIPSLGLRSKLQSHPFVVASWTGKKQTELELIIEPRKGWTRTLQSRAHIESGSPSGLGHVFFTGPHGAVINIDDFEYCLMVASGYGIIANLPLLERLILTRDVRARRIRLVWECEDCELYKSVIPLFNWALIGDRDLRTEGTLAITIYSHQLKAKRLGERAEIVQQSLSMLDVYQGELKEIDKRSRLEEDAANEIRLKRATEIQTGRRDVYMESTSERQRFSILSRSVPLYVKPPRMIITVSASTQLRDSLRMQFQNFGGRDVTLRELEYQPSA